MLIFAVGFAALLCGPAGANDGGVHDASVGDAGTTGADAGHDAGAAQTSDAGGPSTPDAGMSAGNDAGQPPAPVWTCEPSYYGANDGCDCECGIPDPDCASTTPPNDTVYGCPVGVGCSVDGYCEIPSCGNGTVEADVEICDDGNTEAFDGCSPGCKPEPGYSCTADPTVCIPVPSGWSSNIGPFCSDGRYGDGEFCDCGCGVLDADCGDIAASCNGLPLGCIQANAVNIDGEVVWEDITLVPDLADNTRCIGNVCGDTWIAGDEECDDGNDVAGDLCDSQCQVETPPGWTCNPEYVLDPECDCGCGAPDPTCPSLALDPLTQCAFDECRGPENVDPTDHGRCLDVEVEQNDAGPGADDAGDNTDPDPEPEPAPSCQSHAISHTPPVSAAFGVFALILIFGRRKKAVPLNFVTGGTHA